MEPLVPLLLIHWLSALRFCSCSCSRVGWSWEVSALGASPASRTCISRGSPALYSFASMCSLACLDCKELNLNYSAFVAQMNANNDSLSVTLHIYTVNLDRLVANASTDICGRLGKGGVGGCVGGLPCLGLDSKPLAHLILRPTPPAVRGPNSPSTWFPYKVSKPPSVIFAALSFLHKHHHYT